MTIMHRNWLLALIALVCLAPSALAVNVNRNKNKCDDRRRGDCRQVPEGGAGIVYLLGAGITCAGAMLIRSRESKPTQA